MKKSLLTLTAMMLVLSSCTGNVSTSGSGTSTAPLKTFSMAEVEAHTSPEDCYAVLNGSVYDFTAWIKRHPGGPEPIMSICGTDVSNFEHPGTSFSQIEGRMQRYKIGTLQQ